MSDTNLKCFGKTGGFYISFNQDYTSLSVVSKQGYRLFSLSSVDRVDEIFCSHDEDTKIAERLFSSSLVAVVTASEPHKLKVCHFKKGTEICNYSYPSDILSVKLNRSRLIVCLEDSIYIHNIRDMRLLHSIKNMSANPVGLCALSLSSHLAYPVSTTAGELQVFDAGNLTSRLKLKAHESRLLAMNFSFNGTLLATASEKGTVIRVFCVKNGQKVHEFRRGLKRNVSIGSLNFSICASYVVASSNTETVHIFRIDPKCIEQAERRNCIEGATVATGTGPTNTTSSSTESTSASENSSECRTDDSADNAAVGIGWGMGFLTKAVTGFFPTNVVTDVFTQDRAYATVQLAEAGLRYECVLTKVEKETRLLLACENGFFYVYDFDDSKGGECKLIRAHDLRLPLHEVTEVDIGGNENDTSVLNVKMTASMIPAPGTYAGVLKGRPGDRMSDSDRCRDLREAVEYPIKNTIPLYDERQFPPVTPITVE